MKEMDQRIKRMVCGCVVVAFMRPDERANGVGTVELRVR